MAHNQLRILHAFQSYLNNAENWIFRMMNHLPDCENLVAAGEFRKCNFYSPSVMYLEFPLRPASNFSDRRLAVRVFNRIVRSCKRLYPWYLRKTAGRIDLFHSHFSYVGWEYANLAQLMGVPHVVSFYGYDYEYLPTMEPVWKARYQSLFGSASIFICEGAHGAGILTRQGCPPDKIRVVPLGVDVGQIQFVRRSKGEGELNMLQVATLTEKKGHIYALEAFIAASGACPNLTLTFVCRDEGRGTGLMQRLRDRVAAAQVSNRVRFIEYIDYGRLHEFMTEFHVFIHPSCYSADRDCEGGAPIVLLDAQATGMPVISTRHCDIPSEVIDGKTGFLTEEKNIAGLAEAITRLYNMPEGEYQAYARNARTHVETNYDAAKNSRKMKAVYDELVRDPKG